MTVTDVAGWRMAKRRFSAAERYAVFTVHGEKCYMYRKPIDLATMEVDHVIPETLLENPTQLNTILADFGLPADFDLQSFANWLPACGPCNNLKRSHVFESAPLIQRVLQDAQEKAPKAARLAADLVNDRAVSKAWNTIKRADESGELSELIKADIRKFASFHVPRREPEVVSEPMRLTPLIQVLSENDRIRVVRGPYGVGGGPIGPNIDSSFYCSGCGSVAWNGARCVVCGQMDDD